MTLSIQNKQFYKDGKPFRILSGAAHYFRILPQLWEDRLLKLKAMGLNTVETYAPWNFHEPRPDFFRFDGMADIERYLRLAQKIGLYAIVRPSPYICAEWENGGLPFWLNTLGIKELRCSNPQFLRRVQAYYNMLLPRLEALQAANGGPIIAFQIENEYGSYGNDKNYLKALEAMMRAGGLKELFFTSDGPENHLLYGGLSENVPAVVNFGSKAQSAFHSFRQMRPDDPLMCGEFWVGWFDHWGSERHTRSAEDAASELDSILQTGASANIYMAHGGTSFGFTAGANWYPDRGGFMPTVTSYDYDAPIDEQGGLTPKFWALRNVLKRYNPAGANAAPEILNTLPKGEREKLTVSLNESASLFENLGQSVQSLYPLSMDALGQESGVALYRTTVASQLGKQRLYLPEARDLAHVYIGNIFAGEIWRNGQNWLDVSFNRPSQQLDILVFAFGRVNFGPKLGEEKGLPQGAFLHNMQKLSDWSIYGFPLQDISMIRFAKRKTCRHACFLRGFFETSQKADRFLEISGCSLSVAWLNGFNLGRLWDKGPQKRLYAPAHLFKQGANELSLFVFDSENQAEAAFFANPR